MDAPLVDVGSAYLDGMLAASQERSERVEAMRDRVTAEWQEVVDSLGVKANPALAAAFGVPMPAHMSEPDGGVQGAPAQ